MSLVILKLLLVLTLCLDLEVSSSKILAVFPVVSKTRQFVFRPLLNELARLGHEMILVTPYPDINANPKNITEFNNKDVLTDKEKNHIDDDYDQNLEELAVTFIKQIKTPVVSNVLRQKTFDLLIADADVRSILILSHIYDIPVIQLSISGSVFGNDKIIGAPTDQFLFPFGNSQNNPNPTLWERVKGLYIYNSKESAYNSFEKVENELLKKNFGSNIPDLGELYNSVHMLFLNVHPVWDENRPVPSSVLYLGGLHLHPGKPLPQELKKYLDSSKNGVVYMSFGSENKLSHLPKEKLKTIIKVLSEIPYDVLVKANKEEFSEIPKNFKIMPWIPQQEVLKHPKILLFVTQGGVQSTYEAVDSLIPLICIPIINEQRYNSWKIVRHKIGSLLELDKLTEESFRRELNIVVGNNSYRESLKKLRSIFRDQPQPPLQRAVWWTEYVLRHSGARHIRCPTANMPWHQYLELELVLWGVFSTILYVVVCMLTFYGCVKYYYILTSRKKVKLP